MPVIEKYNYASGVEPRPCELSDCKQVMRLHTSKKIANHFKYLPGTKKCRLRYHPGQRQ